MRIPKTLGGCADRLYKLRAESAALKKKLEAVQDETQVIKTYLIDHLPKSEADGITGRFANATVHKKVVGQVKDWPKFYKHVLKTKDFSLMQKRLSDAAFKEHHEEGLKIPGVKPFTVVYVSVTKKR